MLLLLLLLLYTALLSVEERDRQIVLFAMTHDCPNDMTEQIWRELSDRLRQFVRSRINSDPDVDDILQTVFLRIHSRLEDLRKADRLESWVFQITRNAVADHFRRKRDTRDDVESLIDEVDDDAKTVTVELTGCLSTLIERLPEDQQRALSMYELQGVSQKDIATLESITVSGAKSRIQRGRSSLEAILKACCEFQFDRRGNVVEFETTDSNCCEGTCG